MTARLVQVLAGLLVVASPAMPARAAAAPTPEEDEPAVRARVIKQAFRSPGASAKTDDGLWTTDVVVLENAHLSATVVPALGGRVTRLVHKPTGRDLLSGGGPDAGFAFRFPDPGAQPWPEGAAWRIVRDDAGAVTVAVDRRFRPFAGCGPADLSGREAAGTGQEHVLPLRLGVLVTLRPDSPVLEVTGRLDNRLPVRVGFRLWCGARFLMEADARVLLPAGAVADARLATLRPWPGADAVPLDRLAEAGDPVWAVDASGNWVGVYDPSADANHLLIRPRSTAPGTAVRLPDAGAAGRETRRSDADVARPACPAGDTLEVAVGSNATAAHPGHYLQPFGAYVLPVRLAVVRGIGPVVWADERIAVGLERTDAGTVLRVVGLGPAERVRLVVRAGQERSEAQVRLRPDRPLRVRLAGCYERVRLTVLDAEGDALADVTVPPSTRPAAESTLAGLRAEIEPWDWLAKELAGWHPPAGAGGLPAAVQELTQPTDTVTVERLLSAARVLMLAERPGSGRWQAVRGRLAFRADRGAHQATAHAYVALMLALEAGGRVTPAVSRHGVEAAPAPAGYYVSALGALARGDMMGGLRHLRRCTEQAPPIAMGLGDRALPGGDRLHPAALLGGQWPRLLRAVVRLEINQPSRAMAVLERLLREDPSRPEAVALLADAYDRLAEGHTAEAAAHRERALALRAEADRMLSSSPVAARALDALLAEARLGRWTGIPRP